MEEEEEEEFSRPEMSFLLNVDLELLVDDLPAKTTEDVDEDVEAFGPNHEPGNHRDNPSKYNAGSMLCTFPYRTL